ncbi:ThuA domain-containing protein [Dyadobacter sp. CY312]|uniref:ThuA domain-containing protein n=1 Tax=Dyadobacter sp. CY312 TaxID=2907303 RepID=UPI001F1E40BA|nr:ThuA domain-containing protein [Dyadobacter sp. CY312]MCE7039344.1 ThuA domain-containing protein [Dyadobacter sp. CY312]
MNSPHHSLHISRFAFHLLLLIILSFELSAQNTKFKVLAFYTGKNDAAHISFVTEANDWFTRIGKVHKFSYEATSDWAMLNTSYIQNYDVLIFLDTRPESPDQRIAFENYMKNGGGWLGFHFSAFCLANSSFPNNWDWYHNIFLGSGQYKSNTWRPTSATLRIENKNHPALQGIPDIFTATPNEWYRWENDLRKNADIKILAYIDPSSFPLGTGPKPHEIWHSGDYPVVWTNRNYKMVYFNMGHNDIDYEGGTNRSLSQTFSNEIQDKLIISSLLWIAQKQ